MNYFTNLCHTRFPKTDYPRYQWACSYAVRHTPPHHICSSETKAGTVKTLKTWLQKPIGDISVALSSFYKVYGSNTTCDMVTTEIPNSLHTTFFMLYMFLWQMSEPNLKTNKLPRLSRLLLTAYGVTSVSRMLDALLL